MTAGAEIARLVALLPAVPNGPPPGDGWYVIDIGSYRDGEPCVGAVWWDASRRSGFGLGRLGPTTFSSDPIRHAPVVVSPPAEVSEVMAAARAFLTCRTTASALTAAYNRLEAAAR